MQALSYTFVWSTRVNNLQACSRCTSNLGLLYYAGIESRLYSSEPRCRPIKYMTTTFRCNNTRLRISSLPLSHGATCMTGTFRCNDTTFHITDLINLANFLFFSCLLLTWHWRSWYSKPCVIWYINQDETAYMLIIISIYCIATYAFRWSRKTWAKFIIWLQKSTQFWAARWPV